jgi:DNA topoisomerase-1
MCHFEHNCQETSLTTASVEEAASGQPHLKVVEEPVAQASSLLDITTEEIIKDPVESAKAAGLRYVTDTGPGIRRRRAGKHFSYIGVDGRPIRDPNELKRIKALAIPPAWTDVWISPITRGHLQATGRDARGRKQYRYHQRWREVRDETKYYRMLAFGQALPRIRQRVAADLKRSGLPREKVLATLVRLLETTLIRVGNEEYARENKSYGLTTMRNRHVDIKDSQLRFHFRGKSGVKHDVDVRDRRLATIVRKLRDLPGQDLFQYCNEDGNLHDVNSDDVNEYLREITGQDFTAKDFRTWTGTVLAAQALREFEAFDSATQAKKNIVQAIETVSKRLGNTPSVCRKCYVHPQILDAYLDGTTIQIVQDKIQDVMTESIFELNREEAAVMALLHKRLAQ